MELDKSLAATAPDESPVAGAKAATEESAAVTADNKETDSKKGKATLARRKSVGRKKKKKAANDQAGADKGGASGASNNDNSKVLTRKPSYKSSSPSRKGKRASSSSSLVCYLCGRSYGSSSLPIHQKQCKDAWKVRQSLKKDARLRRKLPTPPAELQDFPAPNKASAVNAYNKAAADFYNTVSLVACPGCEKTFEESSLGSHLQGCKKGKAAVRANRTPKKTKKSRSVVCYLCGRQYGITSLSIHTAQCRRLWAEHQLLKKDTSTHRPVPNPPAECANIEPDADLATITAFNKAASDFFNTVSLVPCPGCKRTFQEKSLKSHIKGCAKGKRAAYRASLSSHSLTSLDSAEFTAGLACYLCGASFGTNSLAIHQKQCVRKWERDVNINRAVPSPPEECQQIPSSSSSKKARSFNSAAVAFYRSTVLQPCKKCGTSIKPASYAAHVAACKPKKKRPPSAANGKSALTDSGSRQRVAAVRQRAQTVGGKPRSRAKSLRRIKSRGSPKRKAKRVAKASGSNDVNDAVAVAKEEEEEDVAAASNGVDADENANNVVAQE